MSDTTERVTKRRADTRARLFEAAAQVFAEVGIDAASVEMITERAGFTRGAFYSNFESKDELFYQLIGYLADEKLRLVGERIALLKAEGIEGMPVDELIKRIIDVTLERDLGIGLMNEFRTRAMRDARAAEAYLAWQSALELGVEEIVVDLTHATGLRLRLPPRELARMLLYIWDGTTVQGVIEGRDYEAVCAITNDRTVGIVQALIEVQGQDPAPGRA